MKFLFAAALLLASCSSTERRDAQRTLAVLDALRDADASARPPRLAEAAALKPVLPVAENARASCVRAYGALTRGQELARLAAGPPVDAANLLQAERALEEAEAGVVACEADLTRLRHALAPP